MVYEGADLSILVRDFRELKPPANDRSCSTGNSGRRALDCSLEAILTILVEAERCVVRGYTNICNITVGKDHRTHDLSQAIFNEEVEHESWFSEFLGEGPSGHFLRRGETSPFVSKFLK